MVHVLFNNDLIQAPGDMLLIKLGGISKENAIHLVEWIAGVVKKYIPVALFLFL